MNPSEFVVTLYKGKKAMVSFVTQDAHEARSRCAEWNQTGEDYSSMSERRERVLSEGSTAIEPQEYLTQVGAGYP